MQSIHSASGFWATKLGVRQSPNFEKALATAIEFFRGALPEMSDQSLESHLRPIDFSWPECEIVTLKFGERIYAYRYDPLGPVGMYFTRSGYAARDLGIDPEGRTRSTYRISVVDGTQALWCRTRSVLTTWDARQPDYLAVGGAMQLIVLHAVKKVQLDIAVQSVR